MLEMEIGVHNFPVSHCTGVKNLDKVGQQPNLHKYVPFKHVYPISFMKSWTF